MTKSISTAILVDLLLVRSNCLMVMFVFLPAACAMLGIRALASSSATYAQGSASISADMTSLTSADKKTRSCTESQRPVQWRTTTPDNLSEVNLISNEADSGLKDWQLAPSFTPNDLGIGYTTIDEDRTDMTITTQNPLISARAPSSASSTSSSTSIDSISLFLGPLIPTDTTSTSSSLTSTRSSSTSKSTATAHTTSTEFTTVVSTTLRVTASASTSSSSSSTKNPFTAITSTTSSSSQSTIKTLPLVPSTSSSSSLSSETLPTSPSTAIPTSSSALTPNVIASSAQAGTSNPTTPSPVSPTSSSTMAPMKMLSTSSAIGIGAGVGASSLLISSVLAAWFMIRRRRKRYAEEREKRQSGTDMVMDTDPTRYEKPDFVASQPSSTSAQDAAELSATGVYEMDAGDNVWPGNGRGRTSPRLYRPVQEYGREDGRGRSYVG